MKIKYNDYPCKGMEHTVLPIVILTTTVLFIHYTFIQRSIRVHSSLCSTFVYSDRSRDSGSVIMRMQMLKYRECADDRYGLF